MGKKGVKILRVMSRVEEVHDDRPDHMTRDDVMSYDYMISDDLTGGLLHMMATIKQDITLQRRAEHVIQGALQGLIERIYRVHREDYRVYHQITQLQKLLDTNKSRSTVECKANNILLQVFTDINMQLKES